MLEGTQLAVRKKQNMSSNTPGMIAVGIVSFLVGALIPHIIGPIHEENQMWSLYECTKGAVHCTRSVITNSKEQCEGAKLVSGHDPYRERVCVPERYFREAKP